MSLFNPFLFIRGHPCPRSVQRSLTQNCLKLTIPGFTYNLLPVSCGDIGFKKSLGQVLAWKSGLKVHLLPLGPSCCLQTILMSDLVRSDSLLQIVMAVWRTFFLTFEVYQTANIAISGLSHSIKQIQIFFKAPNSHYYLQRAVTPDWKGSIAL